MLEDKRFYVYIYLDPTLWGVYDFYTKKQGLIRCMCKPIYIGKGVNNRLFDHEKSFEKNKIKNMFFKGELNKIYKLNIKCSVQKIEENLTQEEAWLLEKELIGVFGKKIDKTGILCNIADGGHGGYSGKTCKGQHWTLTEETRQKMRKPKSEEHRKKFIGKNNHRFGKNDHTYGLKKEREKRLMDKNYSKSVRDKISKTIKETGVLKGENNPMFGKPRSDKTKKKISETLKQNHEKRKEYKNGDFNG